MYDTKNGIPHSSIVVGLIFSILLILFSKIGVFTSVYPSFKNATGEMQSASLNFFQTMQNDLNFFFNIEQVRNENKILKEENAKLKQENSEYLLKIQDYQLISNQLEFNKEYHQEPVRVLRIFSNQTELLINKGRDYGFKINDVAVLENNLLGVLIQVEENYAKVRLVTHPDSKVPVVFQEVAVKGVAYGEKVNSINVKEIPNDKELLINYTAIATGTDGVVPYGLVLGRVVNVDSNPTEINQSATLISNIKLNNLTSLFIIVKDYDEN